MDPKARIALLSTHYVINYGAVLQALALAKTLSKHGNEVTVIRYEPELSHDGKRVNWRFKSIKTFVFSLYTFLNWRFRVDRRWLIRSFSNFVEKEFPLSDKQCRTIDEVEFITRDFDFLCVGSDQIWNPSLFNDDIYFLNFPKRNKKQTRIAYAPSIAEHLKKEEYKSLFSRLGNIDKLSVREPQGADGIACYSERTVKVMPDPTFLVELEFWRQMQHKVEGLPESFILVYSLTGGELVKSVVKEVKSRLNMQVVNIGLNGKANKHCDINLTRVSINNFLWLFDNATYVIANSFHSTLFSIHFRKDFCSIILESRGSREKNILSTLGLDEVVVLDLESIKNKQTLRLDYSDVVSRVDSIKSAAMNYLFEND